MTYGERLKYVRNLRHMTQAELGMACGFMNRGDVRIAQYEGTKRYPRESVNKKLADTLGVNPKVLCWNEDDELESLYYHLLWIQLKDEDPHTGQLEIKTIMEEYHNEMDELMDKLEEQEINIEQYKDNLLNSHPYL